MAFPEGAFMVLPIDGGSPRFMTYHAYIVSPEWRERVNKYKEAAGWKCADCGTPDNLTGHHKHYINLGNEPAEDIEILCWPCHQSRHDRPPNNRP